MTVLVLTETVAGKLSSGTLNAITAARMLGPVTVAVAGCDIADSALQAARVRMRTTNGLERLNKELKRRTRVATLFPNPDSCLRLISALLAEQDEEWMTTKIYLTMKP